MRENRNVIESIASQAFTKKDFLELIDKNFPDEEVGCSGTVAVIYNTEMTDGTQMQSVIFGAMLR